MKRFCVLLLLLASSGLCHAGTLSTWDKLSLENRELLIRQYIAGFTAGMTRGISDGISSSATYTKTLGKNTYIDEKMNIYTACSNLINNNFDRIYDESKGWQQLQSKETGHYLAEMDAFLKTYPKCRKRPAYDLVEVLAPIWLGVEKNATYEDAGAGCE